MICRCGAATAVFVTCALASALTVFVSMRFKALRAALVRAYIAGMLIAEQLVVSTGRATQSQSIQLQDPVEVSEQHLDLLAILARSFVSTGFGNGASDFPRRFNVYDADGRFQKNEYDAYSVNNLTGKKSSDGSVLVQFGGCDGKVPNCLPTVPGWNYMVRLYRPLADVLNGTWTFPEARPTS